MLRRVVITGLGGITPIGHTITEFWKNIREGNSGVERIRHFNPEGYKTTIACEVKDFDPANYMDKRLARRHDPFTQYAIAACNEAMGSAKLSDTNYDPERTAVILGVGIGGFLTIQQAFQDLSERGPQRVNPFALPKLIPNIAAAQLAIEHNCLGPVYSIATACASSTDSIAHSMKGIRHGEYDIAITGGVEAPIVTLGVAGFNAIQALSTAYNDNPHAASRPFDSKRDGFVIGEGAVIMILEDLEHAKKRNASIYGEVIGGASTNDAYHVTAPHGEGIGIISAMKKALDDAKIDITDIDYINAHGTSTKINDRVETAAIKKLFGDSANSIAISSTKSVHGHMIGATGAAEAAACLFAIREGFIPPTINYEYPDPECDLNYTPNVGVKRDVKYAMSNSLGFGGHNSVLIIKEYTE